MAKKSNTATSQLVNVDALYFEGNPRTDACMRIPEMVAGLRLHGFRDDQPLVLSEKDREGGKEYLVLCGNRRGTGLTFLRDNHPEDFARALSVHPGKIPAIVHVGLTTQQETEIRIDHSADLDRVPLDPWSEYLAIQQLNAIGTYTEERIAEKLGLFTTKPDGTRTPRRSYVQPRVDLARLPKFVSDEIEKLCKEGKDATLVRWNHIVKLYGVYNKEYPGRTDGLGPLFQEAWQKIMQPVEPSADDTPKARELSPAEAIKRSQSASSNSLREALLIVTRQHDGNLAEIDAAILEGETAVIILKAIADHLGESAYNELVESAMYVIDETETATA
jgi:hypothetical protein